MLQETCFQELKRYVRFSERDAALLAAFGQTASSEFRRIAQESTNVFVITAACVRCSRAKSSHE